MGIEWQGWTYLSVTWSEWIDREAEIHPQLLETDTRTERGESRIGLQIEESVRTRGDGAPKVCNRVVGIHRAFVRTDGSTQHGVPVRQGDERLGCRVGELPQDPLGFPQVSPRLGDLPDSDSGFGETGPARGQAFQTGLAGICKGQRLAKGLGVAEGPESLIKLSGDV